MKTLIKLLLVVLIAGCQPGEETIKKQITRKKSQIKKIENKIATLEEKLSPKDESVSSIPVIIKPMSGEPFNHYIIVYASVEADQYAYISPEIGGQIKQIHVEEGQKVAKGDLLVSVNTEATRNQIKQLESNLDLARITYEKQKNLWDQKIGSEIQYLQAKSNVEALEAQLDALKSQVRMNEVRAPFSGYVNKINQKVGELASQMTPLVQMVNLNVLKITANIPENYISVIEKGEKVEVTFDTYPDMLKTPKIERISNVINPQSRTFEIELSLDNADEKIKPNMISTIRINDFSQDDAFVVPSIIIKQDISGKYVYRAVNKDGKLIAEKVYVKTGLTYDDNTTITEGLKKGDNVIVHGYNQVSNGSIISEKNTNA